MIIEHKCLVEIKIKTHRTSFDHIDLQNKTSPKAYDLFRDLTIYESMVGYKL